MARRSDLERSLDELAALPWWLSLALAPAVYAAVRFGLPLIDMGHPILVNVTPTLAGLAWLPAFALVLLSAGSFRKARVRRRLLERQHGLESIRALPWNEFEQLVGEAYRRMGYGVTETGRAGADGGVDLALRKGDERIAVQCKHWRSRNIGVPTVRELLGAVTATKATSGIVVGSGTFTAPAVTFAREHGIELVDGAKLAQLVADVQAVARRKVGPSVPVTEPAPVAAASSEPPATGSDGSNVGPCTACGSPTVERVAKRGANVGRHFLGCSRYPACRSTRPLDAVPARPSSE